MPQSNFFVSTPQGAQSSFQCGSFDMRIVTSPAARTACFALRLRAYEQYLSIADMPENGLYTDLFDDLPTTLVVGAYDEGRLIASMRLCFSRTWDSLATLPCAAHYPALAAVKRDSSGAFMEVSRVAIDPAITNTSYRTTLYASLVRLGLIAAEAGGVSMVLIATQASSEKFYRYMLGFGRIGEPALYPPGDFKITLLGGDMRQARLRQKAQNSFFRIGQDEIARMRLALADHALIPAVA